MAETTKKITYITGQLGLGGAEKQLFLLAKELHKRGWDVSVITLSPETNNYYQIPLEQNGVEVYGIPLGSSQRSRFIKITKFLKTKKPDIVHSWNLFTNFYAAFCGHYAAVPVIVGSERANEHFTIIDMGRIKYNLNLIGLKFLVTNNQGAAELLAKSHPHIPTYIIPNGIERPYLPMSQNECRKLLDIPDNSLVIGGAGRLEQRKNFKQFINIASLLAEKNENLYFAVLGDGPERFELESIAEKKLPPNTWKFFGYLPDARRYFPAFDIFCYTSLPYEGMPNVIMEACAAGLPVVASAVNGVHEIILNEDSGFLIEDSNSELFVEKINQLIEDNELRETIGKAGKERMEKLFSVEKMTNNMISIYDRW